MIPPTSRRRRQRRRSCCIWSGRASSGPMEPEGSGAGGDFWLLARFARTSRSQALELDQSQKLVNLLNRVLNRIHSALLAAREVFQDFTPGKVTAEYKAGHDPVTEADTAVNAVLRKELQRDGEGWLSEETPDDLDRLDRSRLWVVDPLDGTREFVEGVGEFCVSIALVEHGRPVAGGIFNPVTEELFLGSAAGVTYNGKAAQTSRRDSLCGRHHSCQPQRDQARGMETLRSRRVPSEAYGVGGLQTGAGFGRPRRRYLYAHAQA